MRQPNGYRLYDATAVERLQQILLYRELGFDLKHIGELMANPDYDTITALQQQLKALQVQQAQTDKLIMAVQKTIRSKQEGLEMTDSERFEAFKQQMLDENEEKYGEEIRELYGEQEIEASNQRFANMSEQQFKAAEELAEKITQALLLAVPEGDFTSEAAEEIVKMHKQWLCVFWASYSPEQHKGVAQMYVDDPRFKKHYDDIIPGAAEFLCAAVQHWA